MSLGIIEQLKIIQIHINQTDPLITSFLSQNLIEMPAVEQSGEKIGIGIKENLLLHLTLSCDIAEDIQLSGQVHEYIIDRLFADFQQPLAFFILDCRFPKF